MKEQLAFTVYYKHDIAPSSHYKTIVTLYKGRKRIEQRIFHGSNAHDGLTPAVLFIKRLQEMGAKWLGKKPLRIELAIEDYEKYGVSQGFQYEKRLPFGEVEIKHY